MQTYLRRLDALLWPDLFIIGGGASKKADKLLPNIDVRPEVVAATLQNDAGIVGAAFLAPLGLKIYVKNSSLAPSMAASTMSSSRASWSAQ